ncbi:MAG: DUF1343 domain-containing protein [Rhodothermia bacterium]|nr:MAG: DUF1343 domain-containing protein [Rhodothermia bacterium]
MVGTGCRSSVNNRLPSIQTGAQNLVDSDFEVLQGKRIGLITNHSARVDSVHLIDLLHNAPEVDLKALFGPEHGLRGDTEDGRAVPDAIDDRTGVPVYSLYGINNRPSAEMLAGLDMLVFDIQDVGVRFYTYISTMGRAMQSAAEVDIPFVVLDRPNPLGGVRIDGYVRDSLHVSGVGLYPIPVQHGMTVGELAGMIKGEAFLAGLESLELLVVPMIGWNREMLWPDTGLAWIPTSPNIPTFETALVYPGTGFFEGTSASEGRGTDHPFLTIGAPWIDAEAVVEQMNAIELPGVLFHKEEARPQSIPGVAEGPKFDGETIQAIVIQVTDYRAYVPVQTGVALLGTVFQFTPEKRRKDFFNEKWLGLLAGTDRLQKSIGEGKALDLVTSAWQREVEVFTTRRKKYLLYD